MPLHKTAAAAFGHIFILWCLATSAQTTGSDGPLSATLLGQTPSGTVPFGNDVTYQITTENTDPGGGAVSTGVLIYLDGALQRADSGVFAAVGCVVDAAFPSAWACNGLTATVPQQTFELVWISPNSGLFDIRFEVIGQRPIDNIGGPDFVIDLLTQTQVGDAQVITFDFGGYVSQVSSSLSGTFSVGDSISGSYTFDSSTPDFSGNPDFGTYFAVTQFDALVGSYLASATGDNINVTDGLDGKDEYQAIAKPPNLVAAPIGGLEISMLLLELTDETMSAFSSDSLPTFVDLADFDTARLVLRFGESPDYSFVIATLDGLIPTNDMVGRFDDVPTDYWAFSFIETLAASGITAGCGGGNYCPLDPVTRAQMAVFLERGMNGSNFSPPPATGNVFLDVGAGDFAASFIEQLFADGITAGCGNNNYCPNDTVTRDQMAVFLLRAKHGSGYSPPPATGIFGDVPLSYWAVHWIEQLAAEGITAGCGVGNYCPEAQVTRDQMAVFLVRTFGL